MFIQMTIRTTCVIISFSLALATAHAQIPDAVTSKVMRFPSRLLAKIRSKTTDLNTQLTSQTERYLRQMARQEAHLQKKLFAIDSNAAKTLFAGSADRYAALAQQIHTDTGSRGRSFNGAYLPYLDSLQGSMAFLRQNPSDLSPKAAAQLQGASAQLQALQAKLQDAEQAKAFIQERKQQISAYISQHTNLQKVLAGPAAEMNKQVYYYSQQLRQYKEMWNNPDQLEQKALSLLNQLPNFQSFMKDHSMLGNLFRVPGNYASAQALAGLQTKAQVTQLMQARTGSALPATGGGTGPGGSGAGDAGASSALSAIQSNLQNAESQLDTYKSKLTALGTGNGDMDMPDFKPNDQHTKTFWKRLEYGTNFQTTRTDYYFPTVTDLGLSLGYKLGHNNVVGVGASYKLGWGNGIQHIAFSSQGIGLRSFLQIKIKGSFSASGGFEYNYTTPFPAFSQLPKLEDWTKSGLIGVTKTISVKHRVFKKTNVSLLWDFLSYQQTPQTQPLLFRVGYTFN